MLSDRDFLHVIQHAPLVSVDLLVRRDDDALLLGLRNNQPARGSWFVPGGRIRKNETMEDAFARLTRAELGQSVPFASAIFRGVYTHKYDTNYREAPGIGTHCVCLAYELPFAADMAELPKEQHAEYAWWTSAAAAQSDQVHVHTRAYFDLYPPTGRA